MKTYLLGTYLGIFIFRAVYYLTKLCIPYLLATKG